MAIGIDLGTTNSVVAVFRHGRVHVIDNSEGEKTTPSVVAYKPDGQVLVGNLALRQATTNKDTIIASKRLMGVRWDSEEAKNAKVSYKTVKGRGDSVGIKISSKSDPIMPQQIAAEILRKLASAAENYLGHKEKKAVVTVPAYFNDAQRQATKDAGKIAGLEVIRIINEPTAAALDYISSMKERGEVNQEQKVVIYDLGGGTFDVSVIEASGSVCEVLSTSGDTHLGGEDFDNAVLDYLVAEFESQNPGVKVTDEQMAMQRLREAAEKAKKELSIANSTEINLPYLIPVNGVPKHFNCSLNRAKLESLCDKIIRRTIEPCKKALKDAGLSTGEIDKVILVGGMTRMPKVVQVVEEFFKKKAWSGQNPDHAVAIGAAIQAHNLTADSSEEGTDLLLLDVTPLSLGLETLGGVFTKLIDRNTTIPTKQSQVFSTAADGQTEVTIKVFQGEREMAKDNKLLGQLSLSGIPPAPRGVPQIEVTFDIDANGIVHVSAKDTKTGKEQRASIQNSGGISKDEIDKLVKEAEINADKDKKIKEIIDLKNSADSAIHQAEKTLDEHGSKISEDLKSKINDAIADLRGVHGGEDKDAISSKLEVLNKVIIEVGGQIYGGGSGGGGSEDQNKEDVVDGEFKEN